MRLPLRSVRPRYQVLAWAVLVTLSFPTASPARIICDVINAGLNARGSGLGTRRVVRLGAWAPIVVQLTLEGQTQFNGTLRVAQRDRDGDVCYDYHDVLLRVGADGAATREYTLYTLPTVTANGGVNIEIELLDEDGQIVKVAYGGEFVTTMRPVAEPVVLSDDDYLILSVSTEQIGPIVRLADPRQKFTSLRPINLARIAPEDIPEQWWGLEAMDCIVWDEADPDALNNAQRLALAEWVRQGGLLVPATARHAAALQKSDVFGPMLPVKVGPLTTLKEAARFRKSWLRLPEEDPEYAEAIPLARCSLQSGADVRKIFPVPGTEYRSPNLDTLIARRRVGRGTVVFLAASLRDLIEPGGDPSSFFRSVLEIRTTTGSVHPDRPLFHFLESKIGFTAVGGFFLVFTMLFMMAYVGLATFGSWGFLKSRGWSRHNWTVFAAVAAIAGIVSIAAAQYARGVGQKLHQFTVVDTIAGSSEAYATAYFGLKTGTHSILDVWLSKDYAQQPEPKPTNCFLRPLPASLMADDSHLAFADQRSYQLRPATAELLRVPVRATLKQFEGRWHDRLRGGLDAKVRIGKREFAKSKKDERSIWEPCFDDSSKITNRLGVDLKNCFLFQPTANVYISEIEGFRRAEGPHEILVHALGDIPDGATVRLASRLYYEPDGTERTWDKWHRSLRDWHNQWGKFARQMSFGGPKGRVKAVPQERYKDVLLLLTALSEYDEIDSGIKGFDQMSIVFSRERCRTLDLSDILTNGVVLLVGFAEDAGPVSLCTRSNPKRDYKRVVPNEAWTAYRVLIPVGN